MTDANGGVANVLSSIDAGNGKVYLIDAVLLPAPSAVGADAGASSPVVEGLSAQDVFNALDADGDGLVTEAELRAAAEYRGIQLTEEQIAAFLAADADGYGVDVDEYLTSLDTTVLGPIVLDIYIYKTRVLNITLTEEQLKAIQEEAMRAMIEQQQGTLDRS